MKILSSLFLMLAFSLCAGEQEKEFAQLLSIKNINPSEMQDLCSGKQKEKVAAASEKTSPKAIAMESTDAAKDSLFFDTYFISYQVINGYTFHVADYLDGTRIVTCLDGYLRGLQGVSVNGIQVSESTDVIWYGNYFVHWYITGKVYSYTYKQVIELY
jgi:hypothetical protein